MNPKDQIAQTKPNLSRLPLAPLMEAIAAMAEGALKYAPWNWREQKVNETVYADAAIRHLLQWLSGEDIDPDSGLPHVSKAIAGLLIMRDAQIHGCSIDDRLVKQNLNLKGICEQIAEVTARYPGVEVSYEDPKATGGEPVVVVQPACCKAEIPVADWVDNPEANPEFQRIVAERAKPFCLTEADVGRAVLCRDGSVTEISDVRDDALWPVKYCHDGTDVSCDWFGFAASDRSASPWDIVGYAERAKPFCLTEADVGRAVLCRDGSVTEIFRVDDSDFWPFKYEHGGDTCSCGPNGVSGPNGGQRDWDIVGYAGVKADLFPITRADVGRAVLCRDGFVTEISDVREDGPWPVKYQHDGSSASCDWFGLAGSDRIATPWDIVGYAGVEAEAEPFCITAADVGRMVRLRDGSTSKIEKYRKNNEWPFIYTHGTCEVTCTPYGRQDSDLDSPRERACDILGFIN